MPTTLRILHTSKETCCEHSKHQKVARTHLSIGKPCRAGLPPIEAAKKPRPRKQGSWLDHSRDYVTHCFTGKANKTRPVTTQHYRDRRRRTAATRPKHAIPNPQVIIDPGSGTADVTDVELLITTDEPAATVTFVMFDSENGVRIGPA